MAGEYLSAISGMYNPYMSNYYNMAGFSNIYDTDYMGMNGSLFGATPFMPTFGGGMNYDTYFRNMNDYLSFTSNYNLRMAEIQRNNEMSLNAPDEGIKKAAAILHEKIEANEQEQIQAALENFKRAVKTKYPNQNDELIANRASSIYTQLYNTTIADNIREKGNNSFLQGLYQSLTLGFADNITAEENIAKIYNQPVSRKQSMEKTAGRAAGGAILGSSAALLFKKGKWGIVAGIAGAIIAGATSLFNLRSSEPAG